METLPPLNDMALRDYIVTQAQRYGAEDAEEVAQAVLLDIAGIRLDRPGGKLKRAKAKKFLADPRNRPQLLSRIRQRTLTQLRTARRRRHYEARFAYAGYPESTDEATDRVIYGEEW